MIGLTARAAWRGGYAPAKTLLFASLVALAASGCSGDGLKTGSGGSGGSSSDRGPVIGLSWQPNPSAVDGYSVYYGSSEDAVDRHFTDYSVAAGAINPSDPYIEIAAYYDLGLRDGDEVCLSIQAYNSQGTSGFSIPVCTVIN